jgi:hypothetical protein
VFIFRGIGGFAAKVFIGWGCVKRFLPPSAAEYYFETDVFFMISRSKIMKNTSVSNLNFARSAMKRLFVQLRRFAPNYVL